MPVEHELKLLCALWPFFVFVIVLSKWFFFLSFFACFWTRKRRLIKTYFILCRSGCCSALFLAPTALYGAEVGCCLGNRQHSGCVPFLCHTTFSTAVCGGVSRGGASSGRSQCVDRWAWVWRHAEAGVERRCGQGGLCWNNQGEGQMSVCLSVC